MPTATRSRRRTPEPIPAPAEPVSKLKAAQYLGVDERSVERYIERGQLRSWKIRPKLVRLDMAEVRALLVPVPSAADADPKQPARVVEYEDLGDWVPRAAS
jgi:excisionase family DNA binding protein